MSVPKKENNLLQRLNVAARKDQTPEQINRQRLRFAISTVREETATTRTMARELLHERNTQTLWNEAC
ncbi:hypothetical protein JK207_00360 [Gluconobacter cerinus]|uniref:hypothetical protein n=1 Tax=Gluconobacter cerinus TaxID=38307 RepID=UPI001B8C801E|nr:hypothetical protein [Gluconobacter cerinus]MBS1020487.1 hypothetical protein [Gluconobacter cerinus]